MSKIDNLKQWQRDRHSDGFITDYDYINDDGDKVKDRSYNHPEYGQVTDITNLTKLFQTTLSTTTDVSILVAEAELLDEGRIDEDSNPHIPASEDVLEQAKSRIESRGLTPAWTIFEPDIDSSSEQPATAD